MEIASRQSLSLAWNTFRSLRAQQKVSDNDWEMGARWMDGYKRSAKAFLVALEKYETDKDLPALNRALDVVNVSWGRLYPILVKYYPALTKTPPPL